MLTRGGNAGQLGPYKARTTRAGSPRPTHFMRAKNTGPPRTLLGLLFFFNFYDKTFNV